MCIHVYDSNMGYIAKRLVILCDIVYFSSFLKNGFATYL